LLGGDDGVLLANPPSPTDPAANPSGPTDISSPGVSVRTPWSAWYSPNISSNDVVVGAGDGAGEGPPSGACATGTGSSGACTPVPVVAAKTIAPNTVTAAKLSTVLFFSRKSIDMSEAIACHRLRICGFERALPAIEKIERFAW